MSRSSRPSARPLAPAFKPLRSVQIVAGVVTGVAETATGIGGPPLALVYQHQHPSIFRATIATCFIVGELISLAVLAMAGQVMQTQVRDTLLLMPALLVGALLSRSIHHRVRTRVLRGAVLVFAIVSATLLVVRGWSGGAGQ